jgi:Winged helix DNA-binding domain
MHVATSPPVVAVSWEQVVAYRLEKQHVIERTTPEHLIDVVREMVGMHAQVASAAELQLAARIDGLRPDDVRDALAKRRSLIKAWSMRGTLHLLVPEDLARIVVASGTRERWRETPWQNAFEVTFEQVEAIIAAAADTLSAEPMLRADLADAIATHLSDPVLATKLRTGWGSFLGPVAQRGLLAFGPPAGRNVTFVRPSAWLGRPIAPGELQAAPPAVRGDVSLVPLAALARLVRRFLAAFPGSGRDATARWWGSVRAGLIADARAILGDDVAEIEVAGTRAWTLRTDVEALAAAQPFEGVRLLPAFDPWINELPRRTDAVMTSVHHDRIYRTAGWVTPVVIVDGRVAGTWELTGGKRGGIAVKRLEPWRRGARAELGAEVDRLAAFLDRPLPIDVAASG